MVKFTQGKKQLKYPSLKLNYHFVYFNKCCHSIHHLIVCKKFIRQKMREKIQKFRHKKNHYLVVSGSDIKLREFPVL